MSDRIPPAARVGGAALVLAAVLFLAVFGYLAVRFDYPDVLDRPAAEVLPRLVALGTGGRAVWALYALIPLLLIPAGVGAEAALRAVAPGAAKAASGFATISAFAMTIGLARWPSLHWQLGLAWPEAGSEARAALAAGFAGANAYLGTFLGEFVGELGLNLFFALTAWALLRSPDRPRWLGSLGLAASALGFVALFRNAAPVVAPFAELNNAVLPLWLVGLGVTLLGWPRRRPVWPATHPASSRSNGETRG